MTDPKQERKVLNDVQKLVWKINQTWEDQAVDSCFSFLIIDGKSSQYKKRSRFIKICKKQVINGRMGFGNTTFMFINKFTGEVHKPVSTDSPTRDVRYELKELVKNPKIIDPEGNFLRMSFILKDEITNRDLNKLIR